MKPTERMTQTLQEKGLDNAFSLAVDPTLGYGFLAGRVVYRTPVNEAGLLLEYSSSPAIEPSAVERLGGRLASFQILLMEMYILLEFWL